MPLIATVHLLWLLLAPAGAALLTFGLIRRRKWPSIIGTAALLLSLPAILFCIEVWPLDFLWPVGEVRLPVATGIYQVTLVHFPDSDFYTTGFEVRRPDGKIARVLIDGDDSKWRSPHTLASGTRIYFLRSSSAITSRTPYLDNTDGSLVPGYTGPDGNPFHIKINELDFEPPRARAR